MGTIGPSRRSITPVLQRPDARQPRERSSEIKRPKREQQASKKPVQVAAVINLHLAAKRRPTTPSLEGAVHATVNLY